MSKLIDMKKTAVVVGASSGIGKELAKGLIQRGYSVFNISRTLCDMPEITNYLADVSEIKNFQSAVAKVLEDTSGVIDMAIYSAGYSMAAPVEFVSMEKCRYMFDVNYFGAVEFCKMLIPFMRKREQGRIVLIGSVAGRLPIPFLSFYSATKSALECFVKNLTHELKPFGIHCTLVLPGGTKTAFTKRRDVIDINDLGYRDIYNNAVGNLAQLEQEGMDAKKVAEIVLRAVSRKNPPLIKKTGISNTLVADAAKILPDKMLGDLLKKKFEG